MGVSKSTASYQVTEVQDRAASDFRSGLKMTPALSQVLSHDGDWLRVHLAAEPASDEQRETLGGSPQMVAMATQPRTKRRVRAASQR